MKRCELARELVLEYGRNRLNGVEFGALVWIGKRRSWDFTKNTAAVMSNDGRNFPITNDIMKGLWEGAAGQDRVILSLDYFLRMVQENDMWFGKKIAYENHYYTVPPTVEGIEQFRNHLLAGNQAIIATYGSATKLTKRNVDYVNLAADGKGFWAGYKKRSYVYAGYLKLVEPGYYI
jgi:hypothetical protein